MTKAERMDVLCHATHCQNHDSYGCVKGYIELRSNGYCIYYEEADEDKEDEEDQP